MMENRVSAEGTNRNNETRVIGLEMRLRKNPNEVFEEMEVFPCRYTVPLDSMAYGYHPEIQITIHTARGDVTLQGYLP